ncbi:AAA family ATPase [Endozoicomonas sp. 4G]|uniref:AAA family ATPase n=1 Tax=Endozoicomonas sp. 4G TaxID=2872754 RepID=UPI0020790AEE|nr:AAA family ATPase [Endozoicomonas sp. 4G]
MDGQISGNTNKRMGERGTPDSAVPPKRTKPGVPNETANKVAACAQVMSSLKISPSSLAPSSLAPSGKKVRTVSLTDSSHPKTSHAFDFRFVASDDEVRQLLVAREHQDVAVISHPDDLSQPNLVSRLSISEEGRHTLSAGKLFEGSQPLTLVMDIRKLTSEELPKFNDLLDPDNPCLYDKVSQKKRTLGEHVSLLVLAAPEQLTSVGQRDNAPGADFWRRINRPDNTWQFEAQDGNTPSMAIDKVPPLLTELPPAERSMDDDTTLVIDCHLHSNWRQLLLGGPGVDQQGRIQHLPGRLETLRAGQRVILKGADWQDLAFEQTIRQMLAQRCFESNGKVCQLPDDVQFYQMSVGKDELHSLFQSLSDSNEEGLSSNAAGNPIIINQSNISQWLNTIAITPEGYAVPNTRLLEQVQAGGTVTVTSPLTEALWFRFLGSLQTIRETTGLAPRLQVAHTRQQPKALGLAKNDGHVLSSLQDKVRGHGAFNTVTYRHHAQASRWVNQHPQAPLVIQVNDQTSFSQLFDDIHITSEQKAHFGRHPSKLQEALTTGEPVILRGLETNPTLQQLLEPLAVGQPLSVNGHLQAYPQARVTVLWPESVKSPSTLFNSMVATGTPCPDLDLWAINADRYDIPRAELPEQALDKLYEAFETVPDNLCHPLPKMTDALLNQLILAARRAQQEDQSLQLLPRHWRKAINSTITHGTRQHPTVRDFMKVACWELLPDAHKEPDQATSVDPDQLTAIINGAPQLDRAFVKQNLWSLARAFDPTVFNGSLQLSYEKPLPLPDEDEILDRLCAIIVAHGPENQRQAIAYQLQVDLKAAEPYQSLAIRPTRQIKRLQDALASGWQLTLPPGQTRSDTLHTLASDCFQIAKTTKPETEGIERIKHRLSESLVLQCAGDKPWSTLAGDLYHSNINQEDRESRRLSRLHDRLTDSPVIFLQGETGTGKSYFSAKMANTSGPAAVLSLGPSDSEQTLMKRWQWKEQADGDRTMEQQERMLMDWAKARSDKDDEYLTLVLDEANLTQTGLLASLNGLWEPNPCIYVDGHPVPVSKKHRVILTGNPDDYAGRQLDPALKEKLPRAYYPRLDQAFLRDRVVEPALVNQLQQRSLTDSEINDIARSATKSVMALWQFYQELLPEHEFTPRDLTDICSWVGWYLDRSLSPGDTVDCKQIHSLIQQSFRDVLGPEIGETHQDALSALDIWFAAHYQTDNTLRDKVHSHTLPGIQETFRAVADKFRPDFDTSGSAVCELVQQIGQDLSRAQQAHHHFKKHGGRQATLIEGPAGRGKDVTLNLMIDSIRKQAWDRQESMPEVYFLNACDCSWDEVCKTIQKAKDKGGIVVISEMNLIDSQHLEGELNDILAGDAHPGFHLFATINPPQYSGRKPLSPALKGRFRHLPIRQYKPTELQAIAEKVLPESPEGKSAAEQLTQIHCELRGELEKQTLPLLPTSCDLQNVARVVARGRDFSKEGLHQCLNKHYRLYLMAAKTSLEQLSGSSALAIGKGAFHSGLCRWFNETSGMDRPWLIRRSHRNSTDEKHHEICVEAQLNPEEAKTEIIKRVAQAQWQSSGLSLKPDESDGILTGGLYRYWQQRWFAHRFGKTGVDANSVFPMTEEQQQTMQLSANRPYLHEADRQISAWHANGARWWTAFWHQLSELPEHLVDDFINEALTAGSDKAPEHYEPKPMDKKPMDKKPMDKKPMDKALTAVRDKAPEQYNPQDRAKQIPAIDRSTNYQGQAIRQEEHILFKLTNRCSENYRWSAEDIYVTAQGDIKEINISHLSVQGTEVLIPAQLPDHHQLVTLARDQTLATFEWQPKWRVDNGRYPLPSLTKDDHITAFRVTPDVEHSLFRDCCTGLHSLQLHETTTENIKLAYVVEPIKRGKETRARPEPSTWFDTRCSEHVKTLLNDMFDNIDHQPFEIQEPLRKIKNAENTKQRIGAIRDYCLGFSGDAMPQRNQPFFEFLVKQRQGSCRHRAPVFVVLCRYFGIPCRQISTRNHAFAEYSLDGGQTWESQDLGGAPVKLKKILPEFQPTRQVSGSGAESKKIRDLLKGADLPQQVALAKVYGVTLEALNEALATNGALPTTYLPTVEIVKRLWQEKDLASFSVGVSLLLEKKFLGDDEQQLIGGLTHDDKRKRYNDKLARHTLMSEAVKHILSSSDKDQVTEQLKLLYSKMMDQTGANPKLWFTSMFYTLEDINLNQPSVIEFVREALKSGWLNPPLTYKFSTISFGRHIELLLRLKNVDELRVETTHCLKKCYETWFSRETNSQLWRLAYKSFQKNHPFYITHRCDGFSLSLQDKIKSTSVRIDWTDKPEGIPNIERMLGRQPAFQQLNSGEANHRPVIILWEPDWKCRVINEKVEALVQRKIENSPELQQIGEKNRLNDLREKCRQAIRQAFSHYLYEVTHLKGGGLTYCWCGIHIRIGCQYGAHDPSSPEELYAMMSEMGKGYCEEYVDDACLRGALKASNALVLRSDEMTTIVKEFVSSMNLDSIYESLDF